MLAMRLVSLAASLAAFVAIYLLARGRGLAGQTLACGARRVGRAPGTVEESGQAAGELHRGATSGKRRAAAMKTSARCA